YSAVWLLVEVRIEDANLGDAFHGELVTARRAANGLGRGPVVDAESLLLVRAHVRVQPRYLLHGVALDDGQACPGAGLIDGNLESVRKLSLDHVAWHGGTPWFGSPIVRRHDSGARAAVDRQIHPYCAVGTPKLRYREGWSRQEDDRCSLPKRCTCPPISIANRWVGLSAIWER